MAIAAGVLMILAGLYFGMEGIAISGRAESAMHQIYAAVTILTAATLAAGGSILCALGHANSIRNRTRTDLAGLKAEVAALRGDLARSGTPTGSGSGRPEIDVRP